VWAGRIWEISVPSTQFCCEPKMDLKMKSIKKKEEEEEES